MCSREHDLRRGSCRCLQWDRLSNQACWRCVSRCVLTAERDASGVSRTPAQRARRPRLIAPQWPPGPLKAPRGRILPRKLHRRKRRTQRTSLPARGGFSVLNRSEEHRCWGLDVCLLPHQGLGLNTLTQDENVNKERKLFNFTLRRGCSKTNKSTCQCWHT